MKIKVVTLKDIVKYLVKIGTVFGIIAILTNFFYNNKNAKGYFKFDGKKYLTTVDNEILLLRKDEYDNINTNKDNYITGTINNEFSMFKAVAVTNIDNIFLGYDNSENVDSKESGTSESQENTEEEIEKSNNTENDTQLNEAKTGLPIEVVPSNIVDKTSYEIFGVKLRNESDYNLEAEITDLSVDFNKQDIIIFHTHTCESYTPTEQFKYDSTGNYRTTDLNYSVARVGDELEKYLSNYGYTVTHDKSYHDYPSYNGSYNRSLITVENILENQNTDVVIDLHRDAIGDNTYAPKVKIGDEYCARLMFVIGTDGGGLTHKNWRENLKFAMKQNIIR